MAPLRNPIPKVLCFAGLLFLGLSLTPGCSSTPKENDSASKPISGTDEQIFVGDSLEMTYDPNVIMKRAESFHEKESYAEAIVEYQHFLDLHRTHMLAPYAQYRLALSHFKQFQTIDRDPEPLQQALKKFEELLVAFPSNRHERDAKEKIRECRKFLAEHHLFVGNFYLNKQAYLAAAHRFEIVNNTYPELDLAADAKLKLAKTYQYLGLPEWSRDWAIAVLREHPQHTLRDDSPAVGRSSPGSAPKVRCTQRRGYETASIHQGRGEASPYRSSRVWAGLAFRRSPAAENTTWNMRSYS